MSESKPSKPWKQKIDVSVIFAYWLLILGMLYIMHAIFGYGFLYLDLGMTYVGDFAIGIMLFFIGFLFFDKIIEFQLPVRMVKK